MGNIIKLKITKFSDTPGPRFIIEGENSGEFYRNTVLEPAFKDALENNKKIIVDLDDTYGYGTSFLEEVFGGLARKYPSENILDRISFISKEEPYLIDDIHGYVEDTKK